MCSDKRATQFFQFTERNILGKDSYLDDSLNKKLVKRQIYLIGIVLTCLVTQGVAHMFASDKIKQPRISTAKSIVKTEPLPRLKSEIPPYTLAAAKQRLHVIFLRKADQVAFNTSYERLNDSFVVMDKVVVIPKIIG